MRTTAPPKGRFCYYLHFSYKYSLIHWSVCFYTLNPAPQLEPISILNTQNEFVLLSNICIKDHHFHNNSSLYLFKWANVNSGMKHYSGLGCIEEAASRLCEPTYGACYLWHTVDGSILAFTNFHRLTICAERRWDLEFWLNSSIRQLQSNSCIVNTLASTSQCKRDFIRQIEKGTHCLITTGCSSAVLMCERSSSAVVDTDSVVGGVCVLQGGNTSTAGRSTACPAALHSKNATSINI